MKDPNSFAAVDDFADRAPTGLSQNFYAAGMEFSVLGPIEARMDGKTVGVGGPKQRSILALLIAHAGQPVSLDRIVTGIYGEEAADGARHSVQTYISSIRRDLGDVILREPGGYVLSVDGNSVDAHRFEEVVRSALSILEEDADSAGAMLRDALAIWRGHPYADTEGWGVFEPEITRLSELRLSALEARIDADLATGRHRELLGELDALTLEYPLRERFRGQQMLALYRSGRQTEALRAYERTRSYLGDEVGIEPTPELQDLEQRILEQDPDLDLPAAPSLTSRSVVVVEIADPRSLAQLDPGDRAALVSNLSSAFEAVVRRHDGDGFGQRGAAMYGAFPSVASAATGVSELLAGPSGRGVKVAIDYGDVERHETGEVTGPPVRRGAGLVATAHGGQVLLSGSAHQAVLDEGGPGWLVRSLGRHPIHGVDEPQQVFQLILEGQESEFPPLRLDTTPPPLPGGRTAVAGYELRRPISSDISGTTYRAYQSSVGREVVVTSIDPAWANEPDFVSRFELETQLATRLQHPHIVPVLDYWRDPTGAFLVGPWVEGEVLSRLLETDALGAEEKTRILFQVVEAVDHAHRVGVVHGQISPDAVVLDGSHNAYLGAAAFVLRLVRAPRASSAFTAPEVLRDDAISSTADIYSLGVLAGDLLSDSPAAEAIKDRATRTTPQDRYATVAELLDDLRTVVEIPSSEPRFTESRNPYKGLQAFEEADAGDFHGRAEAIAELLTTLASHRLVAVVGPSGSGKSSLVKAGLVPEVRRAENRWVVTEMFPGSYPFVELESALARIAIEDPSGVFEDLARDEHGLVRAVKRILPTNTRLLLVIDQFEELFTLTRDEESRDRFLDALTTLVHDERSDVRVVLTLRADFFDRPLQYPVFGDLMRDGTFALTTPHADELAEAIARPAEAVGVHWEDGLVAQIVEDIAEAPGILPLLQYALTELFEARTSDEITRKDYALAGGVVGALGSRANDVFEGLDRSRRDTARQVFLRLVSVQGTLGATRRRARLLDLNGIDEPGEVEAVLEAFGEARLLTFDRDPITRGPTVEVAHEALLARWDRLAGWITESREDLLLHHRLADATSDWEQEDRDPAFLLAGGRLAQFETWAHTTSVPLTRAESEYLALSLERADEERTRRRRTRNLVMAGLGIAAVVATVLGVLAWIRGEEASSNAALAHSRELTASAINVLDEDPELSLLLAIAAATESDPTVASLSVLHESLAAHRKVFTYKWPADQDLGLDLLTQLSPDGSRLLASSGGTYIEVVDIESGERVWGRDLGGNGITRATFTHDGSEVAVTYGWAAEVDGAAIDTTTEAALGIHVLDSATGTTTRHLPFDGCGLVVRSDAIGAVGNGESSFLILEVNDDPSCDFTGARLENYNPDDPPWPPTSAIDLATGEIRPLTEVRPFPDAPPSAVVSIDGQTVLSAHLDEASGEGPELFTTRVLNGVSGEEIGQLRGHPMGISRDGSVVLTYDPWWRTRLTWDLSEGIPDEPMVENEGTGLIWLSPDGQAVLQGESSSLELWVAQTGLQFDEILTGLGSHAAVSFSADSSRIAITEVSDTAVVFDLPTPAEVRSVRLCLGFYNGTIETGGEITSVRAACVESPGASQFMVDTESYQVEAEVFPSGGARSALSPDGVYLVDQFNNPEEAIDGPLRLHDAQTGEELARFDGMCEHVFSEGPDCVAFPETPFASYAQDLAFSPDGSLVAMAGDLGDGIPVWDAVTGDLTTIAMVEHASLGPNRVLDVEFSPDGERLAASFRPAPFELWLLSTDNWSSIGRYQSPPSEADVEAPIDNFVFTPDGEILIATDFQDRGSGRIVFMDGMTLEHLAEIPGAHDGGINQLAVNGRGTLVASAGWDGFVRVWDIETLALIHEIPVTGDGSEVGGVAFADETHLSVTVNAVGELRLYTMDETELLSIARSRITRGLTDTECVTYAIDPCPTLQVINQG